MVKNLLLAPKNDSFTWSIKQTNTMTLKDIANKGMEKRGQVFKKTADSNRNQKIQICKGWELIGIASPKKGKVKEIYFINSSGHMETFWDFIDLAQK